MSAEDRYTRRHLLNRLGGTAAVSTLLPFVPFTEAEAQAGTKKRYCYWFTPVNPKSSIVNPTLPAGGGDLVDLKFPNREYAPLNEMAHKIGFYRGLSNKARRAGDLGGGHADSAATMLVGTPAKRNQAGAGTVLGGGNIGLNGASSIDQWMAEEFKKKGVNLPIRDLRYGFDFTSNNKANIRTVSFLNGREMVRQSDPNVVHEQVFNVAGGKMGGGAGPDTSSRKLLLDYIKDEIKIVEKKLTSFDRQRMQSHLSAVEESQATLNAANNVQAGDCAVPGVDAFEGGRLDLAMQSFNKLTAISFNCDLTRIAGGMWLPYQAGKAYHAVVENTNSATWHSATHGKGGGADDFCRKVLNYRAKSFVGLLKELDKFEEAGGKTVLDNTVVHWYTEVSRDHSVDDMPNMLAGGAGHFLTGKQVRVGGAQNKLLLSIAHALDFQLDKFGAYNEGPIDSKYLV